MPSLRALSFAVLLLLSCGAVSTDVAAQAATPSAAGNAGTATVDQRRLFNPTPSERAAEQQGRIFIYDGLHEDDIERAFETEFERIENMMFIRIHKTQPTGQIETQDDGC